MNDYKELQNQYQTAQNMVLSAEKKNNQLNKTIFSKDNLQKETIMKIYNLESQFCTKTQELHQKHEKEIKESVLKERFAKEKIITQLQEVVENLNIENAEIKALHEQ